MSILAVSVLVAEAQTYDLRSVVIVIPRTYAAANPAKVKKVVKSVWSDEHSEDWANTGWITMWRNGDSNQVWYLYVVTMHQIKGIATPEKIATWKAWLDDNPQVRVAISENWYADAKAQGLDYPPEVTP